MQQSEEVYIFIHESIFVGKVRVLYFSLLEFFKETHVGVVLPRGLSEISTIPTSLDLGRKKPVLCFLVR